MSASHAENRIKRMRRLIGRFETAAIVRRKQAERHMRQLLNLFTRLRLEAAKCKQGDFNLVERCGLQADERQHSAILAWLLDEAGGHGIGNRFFRAFATVCAVPVAQRVTNYTVRTEFAGAEAIADIVIFRKGDFLIYVENKVLADEGEDQLNRQWRDLQSRATVLRVPETRRRAVFLTPQGRAPVTGDCKKWHCVSYHTLANSLRRVRNGLEQTKLLYFLEDWLSVMSEFHEVPYAEQGKQTAN